MIKIFHYFLPVMVFLLLFKLEFFLPADVISAMNSENGVVELGQFTIIFAAFCVAIWTLLSIRKPYSKWVFGYISFAALCCFYVAGEEISWGQHIWNWNTPEYWTKYNDQHETNLHNTSSWLDQKPRIALELGVMVGGLIVPLLLKFLPQALPQRFSMLYPHAHFAPIAAIVLIITIFDKIDDALPEIVIFQRASEIDEFFLFYFVLLYLLMMRERILADLLQNKR